MVTLFERKEGTSPVDKLIQLLSLLKTCSLSIVIPYRYSSKKSNYDGTYETITLFPSMSLQKLFSGEGVPEHDITVAGDFNSLSLIHFRFIRCSKSQIEHQPVYGHRSICYNMSKKIIIVGPCSADCLLDSQSYLQIHILH